MKKEDLNREIRKIEEFYEKYKITVSPSFEEGGCGCEHSFSSTRPFYEKEHDFIYSNSSGG